jgi:DSF synthase
MNAIVEFPTLSTRKNYSQLELDYDPELQTLFSWMKPAPRPCFNAALLEEVRHFEKLLEANAGHINHQGRPEPVSYLVAGSKANGAYNLGGDLKMFIEAIERKDHRLLSYYGSLCVENIQRRLSGIGGQIPTISLVQGKAFGGGFECALTSELIVAERSATFSFPETMFNLIPGMGAISLLRRRVGLKKAEEIIMGGQVYSAQEMQALGVVEIVTEDGRGLETTRALIQQRLKKQVAYRALFQAKQICDPVTREELQGVVDVWVNAALQLQARDLRMMARLLRGQERLASESQENSNRESMAHEGPLVAFGGGD